MAIIPKAVKKFLSLYVFNGLVLDHQDTYILKIACVFVKLEQIYCVKVILLNVDATFSWIALILSFIEI